MGLTFMGKALLGLLIMDFGCAECGASEQGLCQSENGIGMMACVRDGFAGTPHACATYARAKPGMGEGPAQIDGTTPTDQRVERAWDGLLELPTPVPQLFGLNSTRARGPRRRTIHRPEETRRS